MSLPRRRPHVQQQDVPETGEAVLLDPERGRVLALNASGAALWELLDGTRSPEDLAQILADAAEIDLERARQDVAALLQRLEEEALLDPDA